MKSLTIVLTLAAGLMGCGSGGTGGVDLDRVTPYAEACIQTVCQYQQQTCLDAAKQRCDQCFDRCSSAFATPSCSSACPNICAARCSSCSAATDQCRALGIRFDPPPVNPALEEQALAYVAECQADFSDPTWLVDFYARSLRHEYSEVFSCLRANQCQEKNCDVDRKLGSVGEAICARQAQCGAPCSESLDDAASAAHVDSLEPALRPALAGELWRCSREPDCATAEACWDALKPAVGLARYRTSH